MKLLKNLEITFSHSLLNILTPVLTFLKIILHPPNLRKKIKKKKFYSFEESENLSPPPPCWQETLRDCIFEGINDISARRYIFPPLNWKTCSHPCRLNKNPASKVIRKVDCRVVRKKTHFEK